MKTKLILEENDMNLDDSILVYKGSKVRIYTANDGEIIYAIGDNNLFRKWYFDDNSSAEKLFKVFQQSNSSRAEFIDCLKQFGYETTTDLVNADMMQFVDRLQESKPIVDEEAEAKKVKRWVFNIQCLDRDNIDNSINFSLPDVPESVRQQLAKNILRWPSNRIYATNEDVVTEATLMHWGNLDKNIKADRRAIIRGRSTGHFGTGFYFVNKEHYGDMSYDYDPSRPVYELDTASYNLFIPKSNTQAYELHDALKILNNLEDSDFIAYDKNQLRQELDDMYWDDDRGMVDFINKYAPDLIKNNYTLNQYIEDERWGGVEEYAKELIDELVNGNERYVVAVEKLLSIFNKPKEYIENSIQKAHHNKSSNDSVSTEFMKNLGYEGVDVSRFVKDEDGYRGIDNFAYGSVIYDLKPGTYKKILDPRKEKKDV